MQLIGMQRFRLENLEGFEFKKNLYTVFFHIVLSHSLPSPSDLQKFCFLKFMFRLLGLYQHVLL